MRQIHRLQINEKSILIGDAILSLCKKIAEEKAKNGEFNNKFKELRQKKTVDFKDAISISNAEGEYGAVIRDFFGGGDGSFIAKVDLTFNRDNDFATRDDFASSEEEIKGSIKLKVRYQFAYKVFKKNDSDALMSGWKNITSTFEFKRVQIQPMAVRHFNLFAQDASGRKEDPTNYLGGKFNSVTVDPQGEVERNSWLKLNNGDTDQGNTSTLGTDQSNNPFKQNLAYILLGTGANPEKNIYLNLTAGSGGAAESFHMYRGEAGSSDFYRLFTTDYKIFTTDDSVDQRGLKSVSKLVKKIRETEVSDVDLTSGFPLYYLARKDYGYSSAWAKHSEFGFTVGKNSQILANSMHLFGAGDQSGSSFSVVFGNVFRRCLSLSGYKQFKNSKNSKPGVKNYEIQAGPIYYYRDFDHLHAHKLYLPKGAQREEEWRENGAMAPIELWDQRMNWKWSGMNNPDSPGIKGSWIFTSGDGLLLRMVPAIQRLIEDIGQPDDAAKFFNATIGLAYETTHSEGTNFLGLWDELDRWESFDKPIDKTGFVSPLIQRVYMSKRGAFKPSKGFPKLIEVKDGRFVFTPKALKLSAYMRELLLMFYWTSWEAKHSLKIEDKSGFTQNIDGLQAIHADILLAAAKQYEETILKPINDSSSDSIKEEYRDFYAFTPFQEGGWWGKARARKHNKSWVENNGSENSYSVPYFTLPDPWEIKLEEEKIPNTDKEKPLQKATTSRALRTAIRKKVTEKELEQYPHNKNQYTGKQIFKGKSIRGDDVHGYEALFEKYFRRVMTDPAWVLPYNHSLRFGIQEFKKNFFKSDSSKADPGQRKDFMKNDVVPEFRDAIGYHESNLNDYMKKMENAPLGPALQKKIIKKYRDKNPDKGDSGYFFAPEISKSTSKSLEDLDLDDLYTGRCSFQFASEDLFFRRLGGSSETFTIDSIYCINSSLILDNANISGKGVIWVKGDLRIKGDLNASQVVLVANNVMAEGSNSVLNVGSIIHYGNKEFDFSSSKINGNLVVTKFGTVKGGSNLEGATLTYNHSFLKKQTHAVTFQPFINSWKWQVGD